MKPQVQICGHLHVLQNVQEVNSFRKHIARVKMGLELKMILPGPIYERRGITGELFHKYPPAYPSYTPAQEGLMA